MDLTTKPHILAIGEALIDVVTLISHPEDAREIPGGSPTNVAMALGRLRRPAILPTWFVDDKRGRLIEEHLATSWIVITSESYGAQHATTATAMINEKGATTYTFDFNWDSTLPTPVSEIALIVHAGSISTAVEPGANTVFEAVKDARPHALITFDPNVRLTVMGDPDSALKLVKRFVSVSDIIKMSDGDIAWLTDGVELKSAIGKWLSMGPRLIIVTRGKKGGLAASASGIRYEAIPGEVKVVDTVGAGDSFMGEVLDATRGLELAGTEGRNVLKNIDLDVVRMTLDHASKISDVTVSRAGTNPSWADELD